MKDVWSAATSRCTPMFAKSANASNFTLHSPTVPVDVNTVAKLRTPMVFLVSKNVTCFRCHAASVCGQIPFNHCITSCLALHTSNRGTRVNNNKISTQHCLSSATMIECALWRRGHNRMCFLALLWLDEVSTLERMCHHSLYVYKTQHVLMFGRRKTIDFLVISTLWLHVALLVFWFFPNIMRSVPLSRPTS